MPPIPLARLLARSGEAEASPGGADDEVDTKMRTAKEASLRDDDNPAILGEEQPRSSSGPTTAADALSSSHLSNPETFSESDLVLVEERLRLGGHIEEANEIERVMKHCRRAAHHHDQVDAAVDEAELLSQRLKNSGVHDEASVVESIVAKLVKHRAARMESRAFGQATNDMLQGSTPLTPRSDFSIGTPAQGPPLPPPTLDPRIGDDWTVFYDSALNRPYYLHKPSGITTWEKPDPDGDIDALLRNTETMRRSHASSTTSEPSQSPSQLPKIPNPRGSSPNLSSATTTTATSSFGGGASASPTSTKAKAAPAKKRRTGCIAGCVDHMNGCAVDRELPEYETSHQLSTEIQDEGSRRGTMGSPDPQGGPTQVDITSPPSPTGRRTPKEPTRACYIGDIQDCKLM